MSEPKYTSSERDEAAQDMRDARALRETWRQRWLLSLTLGNGGALLASASVLLDATKRTLLIVPSAWCFLAGLLLAAIIPAFATKQADKESEHRWVISRATKFTIRVKGVMKSSEEYYKDQITKANWLEMVVGWLAAISAACFVLGMVLGLALITRDTLKQCTQADRAGPGGFACDIRHGFPAPVPPAKAAP